MLPAAITTLFFSLSIVCAHRSTRYFGSLPANFWRLAIATVLLGLWAHTWGAGIGGRAFAWFFWSGCAGFGLGDVALFLALPRIGSRLTVLLTQCLAAPLAAVGEWLWLGTTLTAAQMGSGGLVLIGVALAVAPRDGLQRTRGALLTGVACGVVAAIGQASGAVLSRVANDVARHAGQPIDGASAAYQRILGGVLVAGLFWLAAERWPRPARRAGAASPEVEAGVTSAAVVDGIGVLPAPIAHGAPVEAQREEKQEKKLGRATSEISRRHAWGWVLGNSLAGPVLGVSCFQWALKTMPSGLVLPVVATTPIVVIPLAYWLEGDRPDARTLLGAVVAVAGVVALSLAA